MATPTATPPATEAPPVERAAETCPRCGAECEPQQEYCLGCGLRLPEAATGVVAALGGAWRRRLRWYPGDWMWVVLGLLGIAALGAGLAVLASRGGPEPETIVGTTAPGVTTRPAVQTTPASTAAEQPPSPPAGPSPAAPTPQAPQRQQALLEWPAGQSGWTVVLRSDTSAETARAQARDATGSGLRDVGVLESADYSSLHPGYFVVFTGIYDDQGDADAALATAESAGYPEAYVRPVSP